MRIPYARMVKKTGLSEMEIQAWFFYHHIALKKIAKTPLVPNVQIAVPVPEVYTETEEAKIKRLASVLFRVADMAEVSF